MRILKCDKCGYEVTDRTGLYNADRHGFETLAPKYRFGNVVDLCKKCFKEVEKALDDAGKEAEKYKKKSFLGKLGLG